MSRGSLLTNLGTLLVLRLSGLTSKMGKIILHQRVVMKITPISTIISKVLSTN